MCDNHHKKSKITDTKFSYFELLTYDVLKHLFRYIPFQQRVHLGGVCKLFYKAANADGWDRIDFQGVNQICQSTSYSKTITPYSGIRILKFIEVLTSTHANEVKYLDLSSMVVDVVDPLLHFRFIELMPNLEKLALAHLQRSKEHIEGLESYDYEDVKQLPERPNLKYLNLSSSEDILAVDDPHLAEICRACTNLKVLLLERTAFGELTIEILTDRDQLEVLDITDCGFDSHQPSSLKNIKRIKFSKEADGIWSYAQINRWNKVLKWINQVNSPNMLDSAGLSLLHYIASSDGSNLAIQVLEKLIEEKGADVNVISNNYFVGDKYSNGDYFIRKFDPFRINVPPFVPPSLYMQKTPEVFKTATSLTPLHIAICKENLTIVKYLISKGANVNQKDSTGATPLMLACSIQRVDFIELLIESGSLINDVDNQGWSPLNYAIFNTTYYSPNSAQDLTMNFDEKLFDLLIRNGADINQADKDGKLPFVIACTTACVPLLRYFQSIGAKYNEEGKPFLGFHQLMMASQQSQNYHGPFLYPSQVSCFQWMLDQGFPVNDTDEENNTILHLLCYNVYHDLVEKLLQKEDAKKSLMIKNNAGFLPIHTCCSNNRLKIDINEWESLVTLLINHYPESINEQTSNYETPLMLAIDSEKSTDYLDILIKLGSDPYITRNGCSLLHYLTDSYNYTYSKLEWILHYFDDVNIKDSVGLTPLHFLCDKEVITKNNFRKSITLLISKGADLNAQDYIYQETPIFKLTDRQNNNLFIDIVTSYHNQIDFSKRNIVGNNLLHKAILQFSFRIAILIIENGFCDFNECGQSGQSVTFMVL